MDVTYTHCAGLDVHKKGVVACCITPNEQGEKQVLIRTFGTMTADLLVLSDWLLSFGVTHVGIGLSHTTVFYRKHHARPSAANNAKMSHFR